MFTPRNRPLAPRFITIVLTLIVSSVTHAEPHTFDAHDTPFPDTTAPPWTEQGRAMELRVAWAPQPFSVTVGEPGALPGNTTPVAFPSPRPSGQRFRDVVAVEWFPAQPPPDAAIADGAHDTTRPAVVLVHTLHPAMPLARALAGTVARGNVHAFVIQLPGYGQRRARHDRWAGIEAIVHAAQGVADVRRACDAVAALPGIDPDRIVLQGSSLGSFPAAMAAGLHARHRNVVLFLGGGQLLDVLETGHQDTARLRESLDRHGVDADRRRELLAHLDPLFVAHQLDPQHTWLFTADGDTVVPPNSAKALADAVGLDDEHHRIITGNHYTATLALPAIAAFLIERANEPLEPVEHTIAP